MTSELVGETATLVLRVWDENTSPKHLSGLGLDDPRVANVSQAILDGKLPTDYKVDLVYSGSLFGLFISMEK